MRGPPAHARCRASTRYYLSESGPVARKVFFDFATLPERATSADSTDSTGYATRFNGYGEFVAAISSAMDRTRSACSAASCRWPLPFGGLPRYTFCFSLSLYRPASGTATCVGRYSDSASAIAAANFFRFSGVSRTPRELLSIWKPASGAASRPCRAVLYPPRKNGGLGCGLVGLGADANPRFS